MKELIETKKAPSAIGNYSQAIKVNNVVYFSGQIPLDPETQTIVEGDFLKQAEQVFENLKNVAEAAKGNLDAIVKLTVYLIDLSNMTHINELIAKYFKKPYPARTSFEVKALPKSAAVEIDAIMICD